MRKIAKEARAPRNTRRKGQQDKAYEYIRQRILDLTFKPGERLLTVDLAEHLGLSRTPVREALSRLKQVDLVESDTGWGFRVKFLSYAEVLQLYRVRELLEVEAVRAATSYIDDATIMRLSELQKKAKAAIRRRDLPAFQLSNREFHGIIIAMSENKVLVGMLSQISDKIRLAGTISMRYREERAKEIFATNTQLLSGLRRRDPDVAERAIHAHIASGIKTAGLTSPAFSGPLPLDV